MKEIVSHSSIPKRKKVRKVRKKGIERKEIVSYSSIPKRKSRKSEKEGEGIKANLSDFPFSEATTTTKGKGLGRERKKEWALIFPIFLC